MDAKTQKSSDFLIIFKTFVPEYVWGATRLKQITKYGKNLLGIGYWVGPPNNWVLGGWEKMGKFIGWIPPNKYHPIIFGLARKYEALKLAGKVGILVWGDLGRFGVV